MAVETVTRTEGSTADLKGDIDVNDNLPTQIDLDKVAELPVLDSNGKPHSFKSLYTPTDDNETSRTLIIFIRHFFCGVSFVNPYPQLAESQSTELTCVSL